MKDFTFRWRDLATDKCAEFTANSEEEFCEAAINAAIDYRVASVQQDSNKRYYPCAYLEIRHGVDGSPWQLMRFAWNCPPVRLKGIRSHDGSDKRESDIARIRGSSHIWWESIQKWTTAMLHHLKVGQGSRHPSMAE